MTKKKGRNTKLTAAVQKKIVNYLKQGNTFEVSALSAGVSKSTFYNWMAWGEDPESDPIYHDFREAVEMATALAEAERVKTIMDAAKGRGKFRDNAKWEAAAWFVERRNPVVWGRIDRLKAEMEHSGGVKETHEYNITQNIEWDDAAKQAAKELFKRATITGNLE